MKQKDNFTDTLDQMRNGLKAFITSESDKQTIDTIAGLDKMLDQLQESHQNLTNEYGELKDDYIHVVKNTGFKSSEDPAELYQEEQPKTFEEILNEIIK